MFEYLMPVLLTRTHENSLLDRACCDAVHCQIAYAAQHDVPWVAIAATGSTPSASADA
jgi:cyclic beta-1,2-glucan glucanotransferase